MEVESKATVDSHPNQHCPPDGSSPNLELRQTVENNSNRSDPAHKGLRLGNRSESQPLYSLAGLVKPRNPFNRFKYFGGKPQRGQEGGKDRYDRVVALAEVEGD